MTLTDKDFTTRYEYGVFETDSNEPLRIYDTLYQAEQAVVEISKRRSTIKFTQPVGSVHIKWRKIRTSSWSSNVDTSFDEQKLDVLVQRVNRA